MNPFSILLATSLLNLAICISEVTLNNSKFEIGTIGRPNYSVISGNVFNPNYKVGANSRQYYILKRDSDSYLNAANSFPGNHQQYDMTSYQVPQNSYATPLTQGYSQQQQDGGGWDSGYEKDSQSSKGGATNLIGLIGLIGLKGLKGTIPLIKKAILIFIALLPILIPLAIVKLPIILLKPIITFGRDLSSGNNGISGSVFRSEDQLTEVLGFMEKFNENVATNITDESRSRKWMDIPDSRNNKIPDAGTMFGNMDILGRHADSRCMERIACEGLFKSLPRIFFRFMGDNYVPRKRRYNRERIRRDKRSNSLKLSDPVRVRRKDLATLAVNKLKNAQYLTKVRPITEDIIKTEDVCKQYTCSELF